MNIKFKRLNKPRFTSFTNNLVGHSVPIRTKGNSGVTGIAVDYLVKEWAGSGSGFSGTVDIDIFGVEIKAKDVHTNTAWSIGSMTVEDIINTDYVDSNIYKKLQALFLVRYDNDLGIITSANLYYFDNDEVQTRIQTAYETTRKELIAYKLNHDANVNNQLFVFDTNVKFTSYQKIKGTPGYWFEYMNSGTSFNFRIDMREMDELCSISTAANHPLFDFQ